VLHVAVSPLSEFDDPEEKKKKIVYEEYRILFCKGFVLIAFICVRSEQRIKEFCVSMFSFCRLFLFSSS
jgi:hypothetical protein